MKYRNLTPQEAETKFSRKGSIMLQAGDGLKQYNTDRIYRSGNVAFLKLDSERSYEIVESPEGQLFLQFGTQRHLIHKIFNPDQERLYIIASTCDGTELSIEYTRSQKEAVRIIKRLIGDDDFKSNQSDPDMLLDEYFDYIREEEDNISSVDIALEVINLKQ